MKKFSVPAAAFTREDVEVTDSLVLHSGFLGIDRLTLRHRRYEGGWSAPITREIVRRAPGVGVLLYDPELDKVLLVEQFRVGCLDADNGPWKLELVAGLIDSDESPEQVAIRETREESGIDLEDNGSHGSNNSHDGNRLLPICRYYLSPGSSTEYMVLFCARFDAKQVAGQQENVFGLAEENEDIRIVLMSREEAGSAIATGVIDNAMSIIALQWLNLNLDQVKTDLRVS